jgi:hypothetical protein
MPLLELGTFKVILLEGHPHCCDSIIQGMKPVDYILQVSGLNAFSINGTQ